MAVAFPNPDGFKVLAAQQDCGGQLGDLWDAARVAKVRPATIRVWVSRGKIEPILTGPAGDQYHLPTVKLAADTGRKHTPRDPAANSRGPKPRQTSAA